jgi:hypothetical protein
MNIAVTGTPNLILDAETPASKLRAAMIAERELVVLEKARGGREFIQTGKNAIHLVEVIKSGQVQLIRSSTLDGQYTLGLFDQQERLRILVCRARSIPNAPSPYKLRIGDKEVVSEHIESTKQLYGTAGVVCICTTTWT